MEIEKKDYDWVIEWKKKNLGKKVEFDPTNKHILFPELLPETVAMYDHESFIFFLRKTVPGYFWFEDRLLARPTKKIVDKYLEASLRNTGIYKLISRLKIFNNIWRVSVVFLASLIGASGVAIIDSLTLQNGLLGAGVAIIIFSIMSAVGTLEQYAYNWRIPIQKGKNEQESHHHWNKIILQLWMEEFMANEKYFEENNLIKDEQFTSEEIKQVKIFFLQAVSKSITAEFPSDFQKHGELDPILLHRLRMIFVWGSQNLTDKYQKYHGLTDEDVNRLIAEDYCNLSSPVKEYFSEKSSDNLRYGLRRALKDTLDDEYLEEKIDEYLEDTKFWLSRAIKNKKERKEVTFYQQVLEYTRKFRDEGRDKIWPMILASRAASGKSTIVDMLCYNNTENKEFLPIKLELKNLSNIDVTEKSLKDILCKEIISIKEGTEWTESIKYFFRDGKLRLKQQREDIILPSLLIILDGLDEIKNNKESWKNKIIESSHEIPILLTSRPEEGFENNDYFEFGGLTNSQKKTLIKLKNDNVDDKLLNQMSEVMKNKSKITGKEIQSPFMFFLILEIMEKAKIDGKIEEIDLSLDNISRTFIDKIIEREWMKSKKDRKSIDMKLAKKRIPIEIGKKLLDNKSDKDLIEQAVDLTLLGSDQEPLDYWLKGHYLARYLDSEQSSFKLDKIIGSKEDEERDLILNHLISTSARLFAPDVTPDFGKIAPLIYKIIAEDWLDKNFEGKEKLIEDLGIEWKIGKTDPINEEIVRNLSEKDLSIISGIIHLHCWIIGSDEEKLASWRESESDQAWEQLMMIAFSKIENIREKKDEITYIMYNKMRKISRYNNRSENGTRKSQFDPIPQLNNKWKGIIREYFDGSPNPLEESDQITFFHLNKILRHIKFFKGLHHGVPTGGAYLSFIFDSKDYADMLSNTDMWLPRNPNLNKTQRRKDLISGNNNPKPLTTLILKIVERYSCKSMIFFLSVIESIARQITLGVSYEDFEKIKLQMDLASKTDSSKDPIRLFPQRLINLRLEENLKIKALKIEEKEQMSEEIFRVVIDQSSNDTRLFSLDGKEIYPEGSDFSNFQITWGEESRLRFFDKEFSEIELREIDNNEFTGLCKITSKEEEEWKSLSPILLESNLINEVDKKDVSNAIDILKQSPNSDINSFITIANIRKSNFDGRYGTLLNHNKFKNFVSKIFTKERDLIRAKGKSNVELVILQAIPDYAKPGTYITNLAVSLKHVSKKFLINPPAANLKLSVIVNAFNNDHSLSNHFQTEKKLESLRNDGKILFYFKPYRNFSFNTVNYSLGIPGVMDRDLTIPFDDPITKPITDVLQERKWYRCDFELETTSLGYELILPIPETIELLCDKCLENIVNESQSYCDTCK